MSALGWHAGMMSESYPAVAESVPVARRDLVEFAGERDLEDELLEALRLAASEALTNAVMHAYPVDGEGDVHVTAALAGPELWVLIADDGRGLGPRTDRPGLGLGLALIASVCEYVAFVKRADGGTEVRMRFDLAPGPRPDAGRDAADRWTEASRRSEASSRFPSRR